MPQSTATRERLTSAAISLHHPLDHYFNVFLRAKETEGMKPRTLNDHKSHYRYLQHWLAEHHPVLKLEELSADHVRQYVYHMLSEQALYNGHPTLQRHNSAKGLSPTTVNIRTRTLKCFLRFLHGEGYLQTANRPRFPSQAAEGQRGHDQRIPEGTSAAHLLFDTGLRVVFESFF